MIIFDNETTGLIGPEALPLTKQPQIIEFCAVKLDPKTLKEIAHIDILINPGRPLPEEIVRITGITDRDLKDKKTFAHHLPEITEFFMGVRTLVAHNLAFDSKMLSLELTRIDKQFAFPWPPERICTVETTTHLKGFRLKLADLYSLATDGGTFKGAHRAINDVRATAVCLRWMRKNKIV